GENVGTYAIGIGTLANANYLITFADATFSVTGATHRVHAVGCIDHHRLSHHHHVVDIGRHR
ncbi:MAG: MBG domain-containing protein, partial [Actinomycetota bacterium]